MAITTPRTLVPCRALWLLALALTLLLAVRGVSADIKLLDLDPYRDTGVSGDAYRAGYMAAFHGKKVGTQDVVFLPRNSDEQLADVDVILTRVLQENPDVLAVTGAVGIPVVDAMVNGPVAPANNLVAVGGYSSALRSGDFSRNLFFYEVNMATQGVAMLNLAMRRLQVRTHAIFINSQVGAMKELFPIFLHTVDSVKQPFAGIYDHDGTAPFSAKQTEVIIAAKPQVIYIYATPDDVLTQFLRTVLQDSRTAKTKILTVDTMQPYLEGILPGFKAQDGIELEPGQIILTSSTASSTDTTLQNVLQFHTEMKAYIDAGLTSTFPDSSILTTDTDIATRMLAGWVEGIATLTTLQTSSDVVDRPGFQSSLFTQRRVAAAGDLFYGTYSDMCTPASKQKGWACPCNQGGRSVYYKQLTGEGKIAAGLESIQEFSWSSDICLVTDASPRLSFANGVAFNFTDPELARLRFITESFLELYHNAQDDVGEMTNSVVIQTTLATMQADYDAYFATHKVDMIVGFVPEPTFNSRGAFQVNPIPYRPTVRQTGTSYMYIPPTAKQQIYLFYTFLSSTGDDVHHPISDKTVTVVLKDIIKSETDQYIDFFDKSAATYDVPDPTVRSIDADTAVTSSLSSKGYNYVIGISYEDAVKIVDYLEANSKAVLVLLYDDFATYYDPLMAAMRTKDVSVQERLLSMTNFPLWSDTSAQAESESALLAAFHAAQSSSATYTPRSMGVFVTSLVLSDILNAVQGGVFTATSIESGLYRDTYRYAADTRFGPYTTCNSTLDATLTPGASCTDRNYGAYEISVLSARRALDPTQPANLLPTDPTLVYRNRPKRLSKGAIAGIVVGSVVAATILVVVLVVVLCCCIKKNARDNKNAPKDPNEPVTMIFTDIESSTALWAHIPTLMPDAVARHHDVIRNVIASYKCYEVKTIGDSFMIACKDATTAVQLTTAIQTALLATDFGTTEIDDAYREMELQREDDDDERVYKAHTAHLPEDVYASMWSGLRVRVGVHTGTCDVRYDEVSKGYDYYGETVNMAARTEAIGNGGQVILTEATWDALSDEMRNSLHHTALGPVGLRGVPHPVRMFQVNAVAGRRFPPLRTEIEAVLPDEATEINSSAMGTATSMGVAGLLVSNILKTLIAPFRPAQRAKELKPFLARWGIHAPAKPQSVSLDDYNTFLTNRLAAKVSAVYQRANGRTLGSADPMSYMGSSGGNDPVNRVVNALTNERPTDDIDAAFTTLPRVFVDEGSESVHDVRSGSRGVFSRLVDHLSRRSSGMKPLGRPRRGSALDNDRSGNSNITFISDYSTGSTVNVPPGRGVAKAWAESRVLHVGDKTGEVTRSVDMPMEDAPMFHADPAHVVVTPIPSTGVTLPPRMPKESRRRVPLNPLHPGRSPSPASERDKMP